MEISHAVKIPKTKANNFIDFIRTPMLLYEKQGALAPSLLVN